MRAAVIAAPRLLEIRECPLPAPGPGQVRIQLEGCGVCASNIPPWEGRPWFRYPLEPGALGHEGWGRVHALGSGVRACRPGDRVAFLSAHAYAEYDLAGEEALVRLPPAAEGPFPGEALGCAMNVFRRSRIAPGQAVAVIGVGFLGALIADLARQAGARVLAWSRRPYSQAMARRLGAEVLPGEQAAAVEAAKAFTGGRLCDVVVEATGRQEPLDLAGELCRERGTLVIAGYHQDGPRQVNLQLWNWRGLDVVNAHEREEKTCVAGMAEAVRAVTAGRLRPAPLYTHRFPLRRLGDALDMTRDRPDGFLKAWIAF